MKSKFSRLILVMVAVIAVLAVIVGTARLAYANGWVAWSSGFSNDNNYEVHYLLATHNRVVIHPFTTDTTFSVSVNGSVVCTSAVSGQDCTGEWTATKGASGVLVVLASHASGGLVHWSWEIYGYNVTVVEAGNNVYTPPTHWADGTGIIPATGQNAWSMGKLFSTLSSFLTSSLVNGIFIFGIAIFIGVWILAVLIEWVQRWRENALDRLETPSEREQRALKRKMKAADHKLKKANLDKKYLDTNELEEKNWGRRISQGNSYAGPIGPVRPAD